MDDSVQHGSTDNGSPVPAYVQHAHRFIFGYLIIVALVAVVAGTYAWQHQQVDNLSRQVTSLKARAPTISSPAINQHQVKFVRTVGFPYDLKTTTITTNLGVPADVEAVQVRSGNNNRGSEQIFTDKTNDEVARFTLGYPQFASSG